jgi:Flp pilus assembly protein TadG
MNQSLDRMKGILMAARELRESSRLRAEKKAPEGRRFREYVQEKGASAVEFALVLPLLLLLVFGIIEFGLLLYNKAMITNASREGARAGVLFHTDGDGNLDRLSKAEIEEIVRDYCQNFLVTFSSTPSLMVDADPEPTETIPSGDYLTVTVSYRYSFLLVPAFIAELGGGLDLGASTTMRAE